MLPAGHGRGAAHGPRHGDREIAERLTISWHTARRHVRDTLGKLGLASRAGVAMTLLGAGPDVDPTDTTGAPHG